MNKTRTLPLSLNLRNVTDEIVIYYRMKFARRDALAFIAHLDMLRVFEKAILRAKINCNYSQGFNPRPALVFALPLGVGVETIDDYVDIGMNTKISPIELIERMNKALPDGIRILNASPVDPMPRSIMAIVCSAEYLFLYPGIGRFTDVIKQATSLNIDKTSKGKTREINVKDFLLDIKSDNENALKIKVKAGSKENMRPDIFLKSIVGLDGFSERDALDTLIIRTGTFVDYGDGMEMRPIIA